MIKVKKNLIVYFYAYFAVNLCFIYVNVYLPIYFFTILDVDRTKLAFVQIFAYSALFVRPALAVFFDLKDVKKKIVVIFSAIGVVVGFTLFLLMVEYLVLFGIFLFVNLAAGSILFVAINKIIVESSLDEETKDKNASFTQIGSIFGAILPNIFIFFVFGDDIYSLYSWHAFFLLGILSIIPLVIISLLIKDLKAQTAKSSSDIIKNENIAKIQYIPIVLMSLLIFLFYAERIYEYPMEPWVLSRIGINKFMIVVIAFLILVILNALGVLIAGIVSRKYNRINILIICLLGYGVLMIIAPFTDIIVFFVLFGIMQIFSGFIVVNMFALMIDYSKKKAVYFQLMATFYIVATVIFVPLGTYLSSKISTELIIVIAGVAKLISIIPILFLKKYKVETLN